MKAVVASSASRSGEVGELEKRSESPSLPVLRYSMRSLAGPWVGLLTLAVDLAIVWIVKGRAWRGDWTWGVSYAGAAVIFTSVLVTVVAARDASRVVAPARASLLDTAVGPWRELVRVWFGALLPATAAHLLAVGTVIVSLLLYGADRGQTAAPLAQSAAVLAVSAAMGAFLGVICGPRLGPFLGAVAAGLLVYWEGFVSGRLGISTHVSLVPAPATGFELAIGPVVVQVLSAAVLTAALLLGAALARPSTRLGASSLLWPVLVVAVVAALVTAAAGALVHGQRELRVVAVQATHCSGTMPRVCLTAAHRHLLPSATADLHRVYLGAVSAGVRLDQLPAQVTEGGDAEMLPGRAVLRVDTASLAAGRMDEQVLLSSLIRDRGCLSSFDDPVLPAYTDVYVRAQATLAFLGGLPPFPGVEVMTPAQLGRFLQLAATCQTQAAAAL